MRSLNGRPSDITGCCANSCYLNKNVNSVTLDQNQLHSTVFMVNVHICSYIEDAEQNDDDSEDM